MLVHDIQGKTILSYICVDPRQHVTLTMACYNTTADPLLSKGTIQKKKQEINTRLTVIGLKYLFISLIHHPINM